MALPVRPMLRAFVPTSPYITSEGIINLTLCKS